MSSGACWRDPGLCLRHGKQPMIFMSPQVSLGIIAHNHKRIANNSTCPQTWLIFQKQAQLACQRRQVPLHCMRLQSAVKDSSNCPRKRASSEQGMGTTMQALSVGWRCKRCGLTLPCTAASTTVENITASLKTDPVPPYRALGPIAWANQPLLTLTLPAGFHVS